MEETKLSRASKNNKKSELKDSALLAPVAENGKVHKKSKAKKKVGVVVATSNEESTNKKAHRLIEMMKGPGAAANVQIVQTVGGNKTSAQTNLLGDTKVVVAGGQAKKAKKQKNATKKSNDGENVAAQQTETKSKEDTVLSGADLKKIEKKKAKKAAQKLKKAQRKLMGKTEAKEESSTAITKVKKAKGKVKKAEQKKTSINGDNAEEKSLQNQANADSTSITPPEDVATNTSERVLKKKERKTKKRQQIKEEKLAAKAIRTPAEEEATVFVGNVPVNTKRVQLSRLFQKYGPVNSIRLRSAAGKIIHKHKTRKAAGSLNAYVVLQNKTSAEKALELNGVEFKGVHLRITKAGKSSPAEKDTNEVKRTIFVGNLKYSATEEALREIFSSCGEIEYVRCIRDGDKGCKGVAYVCFKQADAVGLALELKDTMLDERPIHVERYSISKLGAKEQRDAQASRDKVSAKGKRQFGDKTAKKSNNKKVPHDADTTKKHKKSEFRGVKVEGLKKKNKNKKIKNSQASQLAKKIAPKPKV